MGTQTRKKRDTRRYHPAPEGPQTPPPQHLLACVVESMEDAVMTVDSEDRITSWNRAAERLYGYTASEVVGNPLPGIMASEDFNQALGLFERIRHGETIERFEAHAVHKDGHPLWISIRLSPIKDETGRLLGVSALSADITQQIRAESGTQESEAVFRRVTQTIPQLVWTCSPDGQCDYLSPQWGYYTGIPSTEQLGQKWLEAVHPEDRSTACAKWKAAAESREPFDLEYRLRNARGEYRWFKVLASPICDASGHVVKWFGTCTDVEDWKRAEAQLERLVEERTVALRETVRELEALSYTMAHDMRAPLRAMSSFAQIIRETYGSRLEEGGREMLQRISNSATRMDTMICDVLCYTRVLRDRTPLAPVDLDRLVRELIAAYPDWSPPRSRLQVGERIPPVIGHPGLLTQCVSNLVENAIKFVGPGVQPEVRIWAEPAQDRVRLNVRDNGIGIPAEHHDRVFRMFERIHPASEYEGTGIGLTIVRKAAERMGGQVGFESEPGRGSTFWIELPRA